MDSMKKIFAFLLAFCIHINAINLSPASSNTFSMTEWIQNGIRNKGNKAPDSENSVVNLTYVTGDVAILPCRVPPSLQAAWIKQPEKILFMGIKKQVEDSRYSLINSMNAEWNLRIDTLTRSDAGVYLCSVNTLPVISHFTILDVKEPPVFVESQCSPPFLEVREGKDVTLKCTVKGNPRPTISWQHRGPVLLKTNTSQNLFTLIRNEDDSHVREDRLRISGIVRHVEWVFECSAKNGYGETRARRFFIRVIFAPTVIPEAQRIETIEGDSATLTCDVRSNPRGQIYWKRTSDNDIVVPNKIIEVEIVQIGDGLYRTHLRFLSVSSEMLGDYMCICSNELGTTGAAINLSKKFKSFFFDKQPREAGDMHSASRKKDDFFIDDANEKQKFKSLYRHPLLVRDFPIKPSQQHVNLDTGEAWSIKGTPFASGIQKGVISHHSSKGSTFVWNSSGNHVWISSILVLLANVYSF